MSGDFDWWLLDLPRWSLLSRVGGQPDCVTDELFAVGECMYAMTNSAFGGVAADPGVAAFLWARSLAVARLVYDMTPFSDADEGARCPAPPAEVVGFAPVTYAGVIDFYKGHGDRPQVGTMTALLSSEFLLTQIAVIGRIFYFRSQVPDGADQAMAIRFNLTEAHTTSDTR